MAIERCENDAMRSSFQPAAGTHRGVDDAVWGLEEEAQEGREEKGGVGGGGGGGVRKTVQKFTRLSSKINLTKRGWGMAGWVDEESGRSGDDGGGGAGFQMNQLSPPHLPAASAAMSEIVVGRGVVRKERRACRNR